tara:strand:+ start:413 stop:1213 length:801 start_codon:yes stop_codon:yes gene_type:complete
MVHKDIKILTPTPSINKMVQEKLFEQGCSWGGSGCTAIRNTDASYITVYNKELYYGRYKNSFTRNPAQQVHYLQVLAGDTSGRFLKDKGGIYYFVGDIAYWVKDGVLLTESIGAGIEWHLKNLPLIEVDTNEEEIMKDTNTNKMPELEAGKHIVEFKEGNSALVLANGVFLGLSMDSCSTGAIQGWKHISRSPIIENIVRVYEIKDPSTDMRLSLNIKKPINCLNLVWEAQENEIAKEKYEEIQKQIRELQKQADEFYEEHIKTRI